VQCKKNFGMSMFGNTVDDLLLRWNMKYIVRLLRTMI